LRVDKTRRNINLSGWPVPCVQVGTGRDRMATSHTVTADNVVQAPLFEQRTKDVIVRVEPEFLAEQSSVSDSRFIWAYTVEIDNQGAKDLQVTGRFWQIADSRGQVQKVHGSGVVGEQPTIKAGEVFRYTSGAPLTAPSGMMLGTYRVEAPDGESYDIEIPAFVLDSPHEGLVLN